jgi:hypothetical protein
LAEQRALEREATEAACLANPEACDLPGDPARFGLASYNETLKRGEQLSQDANNSEQVAESAALLEVYGFALIAGKLEEELIKSSELLDLCSEFKFGSTLNDKWGTCFITEEYIGSVTWFASAERCEWRYSKVTNQGEITKYYCPEHKIWREGPWLNY